MTILANSRIAGLLLLTSVLAGCSRLVASPSPADIRDIVVLPVENATGSALAAEAPPLADLIGRAPDRPTITAADLLTDALAMVGQHGVYCQSTRMPGKPTLDIALVVEQIGDAKELLQSVIELEKAG